jgi:hypothetical protein
VFFGVPVFTRHGSHLHRVSLSVFTYGGATVKKLAAPIQRISYTPAEAAAACGVGVDHFDTHIAPHLRVVRLGTKRLYPVTELTRFMDDHAEVPVVEQIRP